MGSTHRHAGQRPSPHRSALSTATIHNISHPLRRSLESAEPTCTDTERRVLPVAGAAVTPVRTLGPDGEPILGPVESQIVSGAATIPDVLQFAGGLAIAAIERRRMSAGLDDRRSDPRARERKPVCYWTV
jgi:hypothetical protein